MDTVYVVKTLIPYEGTLGDERYFRLLGDALAEVRVRSLYYWQDTVHADVQGQTWVFEHPEHAVWHEIYCAEVE